MIIRSAAYCIAIAFSPFACAYPERIEFCILKHKTEPDHRSGETGKVVITPFDFYTGVVAGNRKTILQCEPRQHGTVFIQDFHPDRSGRRIQIEKEVFAVERHVPGQEFPLPFGIHGGKAIPTEERDSCRSVFVHGILPSRSGIPAEADIIERDLLFIDRTEIAGRLNVSPVPTVFFRINGTGAVRT